MTVPLRPGRPWPVPPAPEKLACFFCDGETYNPDGICGQCKSDGRSYEDASRPPLTEAEYAAMLPFRMQKIADEVNERLAGVLPEGMRFEWETIREP